MPFIDPATQQTILAALLTVLTTFFGIVMRQLVNARKEREANNKAIQAKQDAMAACIQSMARMQIVEMHDKYVLLGWMPDTAKQSFDRLYNDYEGMGANGLVTQYYEDCMDLPNVKM